LVQGSPKRNMAINLTIQLALAVLRTIGSDPREV
jgi:hypothetical protein